MIIKGASRANPRQLAAHLQRADTNERVTIVELHSPLDNLAEALRDWQCLAAGTRGIKGLYHANIDPDAKYAMTPEQWRRCVDVLEEELGFTGQPRAVVMHEKNGRQHVHVVWQRTHVDTMTLLSDSWTYPKHERASKQLEEEFGHEHVPGKHVKRDRTKQPELPKSKFIHGEWQQAERTGVDPRDRKDAITAIYETCDSGQSLKSALEEEGYVLARGDRRDFVIVDEAGEIHSLARQINGVKAKALREFMADIDRDALPDVKQARETQTRMTESERVREDAAKRAEAEFKAQQPTPVAVEDVQKRKAIEEAVAVRAAAERKKLADSYSNEREQLRHVLEIEAEEKTRALDQQQRHQREQLAAKLRAEREAREGILNKLDKIIRPKRAKQFEDDRKARADTLKARQRIERTGLIASLEREKKTELETLEERQAQRLRDLDRRKQEEIERYLREAEAARRLLEGRQRTLVGQKKTMKDLLERPPKPTR